MRKLLITLLFIYIFGNLNTQNAFIGQIIVDPNQAQSNNACELIPELAEGNFQSCFEKIKKVIGCFPVKMQKSILDSHLENNDVDRCVSPVLLKEHMNKHLEDMVSEINSNLSNSLAKLRNSLQCFSGHSKKKNPKLNEALKTSFKSVAYLSQCYLKFIKSFTKIFASRLRFITTTRNLVDKYYYTEADNKGGFQWNKEEANTLVSAFNKFLVCDHSEKQQLVQAVTGVHEKIAKSCDIKYHNDTSNSSSSSSNHTPTEIDIRREVENFLPRDARSIESYFPRSISLERLSNSTRQDIEREVNKYLPDGKVFQIPENFPNLTPDEFVAFDQHLVHIINSKENRFKLLNVLEYMDDIEKFVNRHYYAYEDLYLPKNASDLTQTTLQHLLIYVKKFAAADPDFVRIRLDDIKHANNEINKKIAPYPIKIRLPKNGPNLNYDELKSFIISVLPLKEHLNFDLNHNETEELDSIGKSISGNVPEYFGETELNYRDLPHDLSEYTVADLEYIRNQTLKLLPPVLTYNLNPSLLTPSERQLVKFLHNLDYLIDQNNDFSRKYDFLIETEKVKELIQKIVPFEGEMPEIYKQSSFEEVKALVYKYLEVYTQDKVLLDRLVDDANSTVQNYPKSQPFDAFVNVTELKKKPVEFNITSETNGLQNLLRGIKFTNQYFNNTKAEIEKQNIIDLINFYEKLLQKKTIMAGSDYYFTTNLMIEGLVSKYPAQGLLMKKKIKNTPKYCFSNGTSMFAQLLSKTPSKGKDLFIQKHLYENKCSKDYLFIYKKGKLSSKEFEIAEEVIISSSKISDIYYFGGCVNGIKFDYMSMKKNGRKMIALSNNEIDYCGRKVIHNLKCSLSSKKKSTACRKLCSYCNVFADMKCSESRLYTKLLKKVSDKLIVPDQCDLTNAYYSVEDCFNFINQHLLKNSFSLNTGKLTSLSRIIDFSNKARAEAVEKEEIKAPITPIIMEESDDTPNDNTAFVTEYKLMLNNVEFKIDANTENNIIDVNKLVDSMNSSMLIKLSSFVIMTVLLLALI